MTEKEWKARLSLFEEDAKRMAEFLNGGSWETDYTETQKIGWCQKIDYTKYLFTPEDHAELLYKNKLDYTTLKRN